jgi:hypothetical protein
MAQLRGGAILPDICLYATIQYVTGGSDLDIKTFTGISSALFYRCVWRTVKAIHRYSHLFIHFLSITDELEMTAEGFSDRNLLPPRLGCLLSIGIVLMTKAKLCGMAQMIKLNDSAWYSKMILKLHQTIDHHCSKEQHPPATFLYNNIL